MWQCPRTISGKTTNSSKLDRDWESITYVSLVVTIRSCTKCRTCHVGLQNVNHWSDISGGEYLGLTQLDGNEFVV